MLRAPNQHARWVFKKPSMTDPATSAAPVIIRQDDLWSPYFLPGESIEERKLRLHAVRFTIQDPLLFDCIAYPGAHTRYHIGSFTQWKGLGSALLTYFTRQALGISRLPFCEDRQFTDLHHPQQLQCLPEIWQELTPERIASICSEVAALYAHTQQQLHKVGLTTITLNRRIAKGANAYGQYTNYAEHIVRLKQAAEALGHDTIRFEMDTLNSFGDGGGYSHYPILLRLAIDARDILYCCRLIDPKGDRLGYAVETEEWVTINRSPTGVVEVPINAISFDPEAFQSKYLMSKQAHQAFWDRFQPIVLRRSRNEQTDASYHGNCLKPSLRWRVRHALQTLLGRSSCD